MAEETHANAADEVPLPEAEAPPQPENPPEAPGQELNKPAEETTLSAAMKEESNPEKKALDELKLLLQSTLSPPPAPGPATEEPTPPPPADGPAPPSDPPAAAAASEDDGAKTVEAIAESVVPVAAPTAADEKAATPPEEILIWGVPLLSDTVLLKFLRARDLNPKAALTMITSTLQWRQSFGIETLLSEDPAISEEMSKVVFMSGADKEGHPVCYNVYGELQKKGVYEEVFGDKEKRERFLRWRIRFLEKGIREVLDFGEGGVSTMVQVMDLKDSPGLMKKELRVALDVLQDNYPEFVEKQIFINVPWWYLAFNRMISPFLTQRTKSKFIFAGPSKSAETLFSYISPEQVPVQFGGLAEENNPDFTTADAVTEITIKPSSKQIIEIPVTEACLLVWQLRVLGWDVTFGAEFVPGSEDGYTVIVEKARKLVASDEPVAKNSFKISEPGRVVLTVDNTTSKKKKLLYRHKAKSCVKEC